MVSTPNYQRTVAACYLAMITQAFIINVTALLFVSLQNQFGLSYSQLGLLVFVNFGVQVVVDILCAAPADRFGFRPMVLLSPVFIVIGVLLFVLTPYIFNNVFAGFVIATVFFAMSGGLLEVLVSPIIDNLPMPNKEKRMSMLHAFYGWGQAIVVIVTTTAIFLLGESRWQIVMAMWLVVPILTFILFTKAPILNSSDKADRVPFKAYGFKPFFLVALLAIIMGGAAENIMVQWSSTFMENSLQIPKIWGDLLAVATFAISLAIGRTLYGKRGGKIKLSYFLCGGSFLACICYLILVFVNVTWVPVLACALCGFFVSLLWPGTLVTASAHYPFAGAALFAILAFGGDIGAALGSWLTGKVTDIALESSWVAELAAKTGMEHEQLSLKVGLIVGVVMVLLCFICHIVLAWMGKAARDKKDDGEPAPLYNAGEAVGEEA